MWLLSTARAELHFFNSPPTGTEAYAILSHRWQSTEDSHRRLQDLQAACTLSDDNPRNHVSDKTRNCCLKAEADGYKWLWIDTCCIDKSSSADLSEAVNSMYAWYTGAAVCYAYLQDVAAVDISKSATCAAFSQSKWFTRGWTLQELLAPQSVVFLSDKWIVLGTKSEKKVAQLVNTVTGIDQEVLAGKKTLDEISIARRMSWASNRTTTRVEDRAYSLMGIFDVSMPIIYGEGERAFFRLQMEIIRQSPDQSIFAWGKTDPVAPLPVVPLLGTAPFSPTTPRNESLLAPSPSEFANSAGIQPIPMSELSSSLEIVMEKPEVVATSYGIRIRLPVIKLHFHYEGLVAGALACRDTAQGNVIIGLFLFQLYMDEPWYTNKLNRIVALSDPTGTGAGLSYPIHRPQWQDLYLASRRASSIVAPVLRRNDWDQQLFYIPCWLFIDPHTTKELRHAGWSAHVSQADWEGEGWDIDTPMLHLPQSVTTKLGRNFLTFTHSRSSEKFTLHLGGRLRPSRTGSFLLGSTVTIFDPEPQKPSRIWGMPGTRRTASEPETVPPPDYEAINSWPNQSRQFGDAERSVSLTFVRWGPVELQTYSIKVALGGTVYKPRTGYRAASGAVL